MKLDDYIKYKHEELERFRADVLENKDDPTFAGNFEAQDFEWWEDEFNAYLDCMDLMQQDLEWMFGGSDTVH